MSQDIPSHILKSLMNAFSNGRLGHALLLLGANQKKELSAQHIAAGLLCKNWHPQSSQTLGCQVCMDCKQVFQNTHINLHYIMTESELLKRQPDNKEKTTTSSSEIRIETVRALNREQHMSCLDESPRIWIIINAHHFSHQAANALLKTLEEPQSNRFLILLAPSLHSILPTIASRCQRLQFSNTNELEMDISHQQAACSFFEQVQNANPFEKYRLIEMLSKNKESTLTQLAGLQLFVMQLIRSSLQSSLPYALNRKQLALIAEALETTQIDIKTHINAQLALEKLFLQSWPQAPATRSF